MLSKSSAQTKKIAAKIARNLLKASARSGSAFGGKSYKYKLKIHNALVVALAGDLGSGKTTFVQGFARALGIKRRMLSPTFLIMRKYGITSFNLRALSFKYFYHVDLYRIKKASELDILGFREMLADPRNIVVIEWADRIKRIIPKSAHWIFLKHRKNPLERLIQLS